MNDAYETRPPLDAPALGLIAASVVLIGAGYAIWQQIPVNLHLPASALSLACYVFGFALLLCAGSSRAPRNALALAGLLFAFLAFASCQLVYATRYYGTDSLLFNAYSADLLRHGIDPYTQSMQQAFRAFNVPESLVTPTSDGHAVFKLSYPALSFLIYLPALALHVDNVLWVSVLAHAALIVALWWLAPPAFRGLAPLLLFADPSYTQYTVGAVTDVLWVLPAVFAAAFWSRKIPLAALLLGLACAFKQTPWLLVPFALIDWTRIAVRTRSASQLFVPASLLAIAFLVPNAPFIVWHPQAWFAGVTEPLGGKLVMFGSGIVQLQTANALALDPQFLSALSLAALAAALVLYAVYPVRARFLPFVAPAIAYFLAPRSLQNYFMYWPMLVAANAMSPFAFVAGDRRAAAAALGAWRRVAIPALALVGFCIVLAAGARAVVARDEDPSIAVRSAQMDGDTGAVTGFWIRASGGKHAPRFVRFALYQEGQGVDFEFLGNDIERLGAQTRTLYVPVPRAVASRISADASVQLVAVDAMTGQQFYAPPGRYVADSVLLRNGKLRRWAGEPYAMPLDWEYSDADVRAGEVRRAGRADALTLAALPPTDAEWRVVAVSQTVNASPGWLRLRLKPLRDYVGDAYPRALFGIEIVDPYDNHTYYTIDSRLHEPKTYTRDRFTVNVVPGTLGVWNDINVQVRPQANGDPFLPPNATVRLNVVAAIRHGETGTVGGEFGGISEVAQ